MLFCNVWPPQEDTKAYLSKAGKYASNPGFQSETEKSCMNAGGDALPAAMPKKGLELLSVLNAQTKALHFRNLDQGSLLRLVRTSKTQETAETFSTGRHL